MKLFTQDCPSCPPSSTGPGILLIILPLDVTTFFSLGSHLPTLKTWPRVLFSPRFEQGESMLFPFPFPAKVWHALPHWPGPRARVPALLYTLAWVMPFPAPSIQTVPTFQQNSDLEPQQERGPTIGASAYYGVAWSWELTCDHRNHRPNSCLRKPQEGFKALISPPSTNLNGGDGHPSIHEIFQTILLIILGGRSLSSCLSLSPFSRGKRSFVFPKPIWEVMSGQRPNSGYMSLKPQILLPWQQRGHRRTHRRSRVLY